MSSEGQFESRYVAALDDTLRNALSEARRLYDSMVEELQAEMCLVKKENEALRSKYNRLKKQRRVDTASQCDVLCPPDCNEVYPEQQERSLSLVPEEQDLLQRPSEDDENGETVPLSTSTEHMKTQAGLEDCGASQTSSDGQQLFSHCSETDSVGSDDREETREELPALNSMNAHNTQIVDRQRWSLRNKLSTAKSAVHQGEKPFTCAVCGKGCHQMSDLKKHMCTHTGDKPFICTVCGEGFRKEVGLNLHKSIHVGTLRCAVCGNGFNQERFLKMHMRIHTGEELCICTVCNKPFTEKRYLTNHMRTHTGERLFTCAVCGKGFLQSGHLEMHNRIHTGEKPFTCAVCDKSFHQNAGLKKHMLVHVAQKPYTCKVCNKLFTQKVHLAMHIRLHTGEKPYCCTVCSKSFPLNAGLKKHMVVHAVQKPYTCKACNKCFTQKVHLVMHIRLHTGEKPYSCTVCSKRFYSNIKLKRHMASHTEDEILEKPMTLIHAGQEPCINDMLSMITFDHSYAAEFPL